MNIAICDDEQIYADEIKKHVECYFTRREVPHKIYVFTDGQAAARSEVKFDIAFLDIEIGSVSGLDVGKAQSEYRFYSCYGVFKVSRRRVGFKGSAISRKAD